jgi:PAS domain S-box-containing protein
MTFFSFLITILFFVISLLFFQSIDKVIRKTIENKLLTISNETANKIERFLFERYGDIKVLSINSILTDSNIDPVKKSQYLDFVRSSYKTYDYILISDLKCNIIAKSGTVNDSLNVMEIIKKTLINPVYVSDINYQSGKEGLYFSAPLINNGKIVGVVIEKMNLKFIRDIVKSVRIGDKGYAYLLNEDNRCLLKENDKAEIDTQRFKSPGVYYYNYHGDNYVHVVSIVKHYPTQLKNLYLVLEDTEKEAFGIINKVWNFTLTVMLISIIAVLIFAWLISTLITLPVKRLVDQTSRLAKGEKLENLKIESKDEFGSLANSLNLIVNNLNMLTSQILENSGQVVSIEEIRQYFNKYTNGLNSAIITVDKNGKILSANQKAIELTGLDAVTLNDMSIYDKSPENLHELFNKMKECLLNAKVLARQLVKFKINDKDSAIILNCSLQKDKSAKTIGMVAVFREHDEYLSFEQSLERAKVLNSLGMMSAGIAHEIKNPLSSIKGYAQYIKNTLPESDELQNDIDVIIYETNRLNRIVDRFSYFANQKKPVLNKTDVNLIINKALKALEFSKKDQIDIILNLNTLPLINLDAEQIEQVIINLLLNAFQAIENQGFVKISTRVDLNRQMLEIDIEDNGKGIQAKDFDRIFDPFYTTKEKGTGLGLAICARIIEEHKGFIDCQSLPGKVTLFSIKLTLKD